MNYDQYTGIVRAVVPAIVAYLAGKGYFSADTAATIGAAILAIAAAVWSILNNKSGKTIT